MTLRLRAGSVMAWPATMGPRSSRFGNWSRTFPTSRIQRCNGKRSWPELITSSVPDGQQLLEEPNADAVDDAGLDAQSDRDALRGRGFGFATIPTSGSGACLSISINELVSFAVQTTITT